MLHRFKRTIFILSLVIFVGLGFLIYINKSQWFSITKSRLMGASESGGGGEIHADTFADLYAAQLITGSFESRKMLIKKYCDFLFSGQDNKAKNGFVKGAYKYEPKKSVFVYGMCTYVDKGYDDNFSEIKEYLKTDYKFESQSTQKNFDNSKACDKESDMNACNYSNVLSKLFKDIINDYSNIKLASMLGYEKDDIEKNIEDFAKLYFPNKECEDGGYHYLNKENIEDEKKKHCSHPKTYKLLKEYIENIKNKIKNTKFVKVEGMNDGYFYDNLLKKEKYDFKGFKQLMFNELMFYNLFMNYYTYALSVDSSLHPLEVGGDYTKMMADKDSEQMLSAYEISLSQQAVYQTDRLLANLYSNFPVHIGLMAYYEDVLNFRKKLAKVFTPFHQMHYKMQNVQDMRK